MIVGRSRIAGPSGTSDAPSTSKNSRVSATFTRTLRPQRRFRAASPLRLPGHPDELRETSRLPVCLRTHARVVQETVDRARNLVEGHGNPSLGEASRVLPTLVGEDV